MSADSSGNSGSSQSAAIRPQPNGAAGERRLLGRDDVNKARELIFNGEKSAGSAGETTDANRRAPPPMARDDEGGRPGDRDPGFRAPERRPDAGDARQNRPALDFDDDDEPTPKRKRSKSIADFAAELEVDPQQLYALAVPIGDDPEEEPLTIGQMKDRIKEVRDFDRRRDDFEDYRDQSMNEVANARMQIEGVLQRITQVVPPEQLASAFADYAYGHEQQVRTSRLQLREWFPEWDDVQVKTRDREKLDKFLGTYGITKYEIDNLTDARLVRFAMHSMRLMERYERLKNGGTREKVPTTEPTSNRKPRRDVRTEAQSLAKSGDIVGGVKALLR
jgi:hypothetical protein